MCSISGKHKIFNIKSIKNLMEPLKWNPENNGKQNLVKIKL